MGQISIDTLTVADANLTRSFVAAAASFVVTIVVRLFTPAETTFPAALGALGAAGLAGYVWYAVAAGEAAKVLGSTRWLYTTWILVAPFVGLLPIPIVSTLISASPLSIKFLLGGQLQTAIRDQMFVALRD